MTVSTFDIPFESGERLLTLDVHRPDTTEAAPVVLYWHGGGWAAGHSRDGVEQRLMPFVRAGNVVVSANYHSSAVQKYPTQYEDVRAALNWTLGSIHAYGGDPERVLLAGASSGGHLAALLTLAGVPSAVRGTLLYFPVADPERRDQEDARMPRPPSDTFAGRHADQRGSWPPPPRGAALLGGRRADTFDPNPNLLAIPVQGGLPPFLILHGSADTSVGSAHSRELHERLSAAGTESTFIELGGVDHAAADFFQPPVADAVHAFIRLALASPN